MMDPTRLLKFPSLAPLSPPLAVHLASYLVRTSPRDAGRPRGPAMDVASRTEQRLLEALDSLGPRFEQVRQEVYNEMKDAVQEDALTPNWLLQALARVTPGDRIVYPQRLVDWRREGVLHYNRRGQPDAQSVAGLLVARRIDPRRKGWLPYQLDQNEKHLGWACWQQVAPDQQPGPYLLHLTDKAETEIPAEQSLLWSPWKGATWIKGWLDVPGGAVGWSAPELVTADLLQKWAPHLISADHDERNVAELSALVLRYLATDRLLPGPAAGS
jgi:hypothetical protein